MAKFYVGQRVRLVRYKAVSTDAVLVNDPVPLGSAATIVGQQPGKELFNIVRFDDVQSKRTLQPFAGCYACGDDHLEPIIDYPDWTAMASARTVGDEQVDETLRVAVKS